MNSILEALKNSLAGGAAFAVLSEGAIKATAILGVAALFALLLRRSSAARRHLVWACALGALALMPALLAVLPAWRVGAPALAWVAPAPPEATSASLEAAAAREATEASLEEGTRRPTGSMR